MATTETTIPTKYVEPDEYSDDPYHSLKSADEKLLRNEKIDSGDVKTAVPKDTKTDDDDADGQNATMAEVMEQVDDFKKTMNPKKLKDAWVLFVDILKGKSDFKEPLCAFITKIYYKTLRTPEAQKSKNLLKSQFSWITSFVVGLWVLINWWYVINHTSFTVNVMKYTEMFPGLIRPVFEAPLYAIDVLNYYLINMREDRELDPARCELLSSIWGWRPIVFFLLFMVFTAIFAGTDLKDAITVVTGMSSTATGFMFAISIFAFLYFNLCEDRLGLLMKLLGGGLVGIVGTVVLFLLGFIIMLVFCTMATAFYSTFLVFISLFSVFFFGFPNIIGEIQNIFRVIRTAPVSNPDTDSYFGKIQNLLFQNFLDIMMAIVIIPLMISQITDTYSGVSNKNMMITMIVFQVLILTSYFKTVTYPVMKPIFDLIQSLYEEQKSKAMAGLAMAKEMMKEKSGFNQIKGKMDDAMNKLKSGQGIDPMAALNNMSGLVPGAANLMPGAASLMPGLMPGTKSAGAPIETK